MSSAGSQIILANPQVKQFQILSLVNISFQNFDTVIVDEAAQGIEISTLIPLKYGNQFIISSNQINFNARVQTTYFDW